MTSWRSLRARQVGAVVGIGEQSVDDRGARQRVGRLEERHDVEAPGHPGTARRQHIEHVRRPLRVKLIT